MYTVVEKGTQAENLTGKAPRIIARIEWYGKFAHLVERVSDGKHFVIAPKGMNKCAIDSFVSNYVGIV